MGDEHDDDEPKYNWELDYRELWSLWNHELRYKPAPEEAYEAANRAYSRRMWGPQSGRPSQRQHGTHGAGRHQKRGSAHRMGHFQGETLPTWARSEHRTHGRKRYATPYGGLIAYRSKLTRHSADFYIRFDSWMTPEECLVAAILDPVALKEQELALLRDLAAEDEAWEHREPENRIELARYVYGKWERDETWWDAPGEDPSTFRDRRRPLEQRKKIAHWVRRFDQIVRLTGRYPSHSMSHPEEGA